MAKFGSDVVYKSDCEYILLYLGADLRKQRIYRYFRPTELDQIVLTRIEKKNKNYIYREVYAHHASEPVSHS